MGIPKPIRRFFFQWIEALDCDLWNMNKTILEKHEKSKHYGLHLLLKGDFWEYMNDQMEMNNQSKQLLILGNHFPYGK